MGQGPNSQMLDYEASFSVPAQEIRLYNLMSGKQSEDNPSPLEKTKEGAPVRNELLNPKLRYLLLRSAGWNKEANKLLSDAGKKYRLKNEGLPSKKRPGLINKPLITDNEPRIKNDLLDSGSLEDNLIRESAPKPDPKPKSEEGATNDLLLSGSLEDNLIREPAPKPAPKPKSKEEATADRLLQVGAGVLYDSEQEGLLRKEYIANVLPKYLEATSKDGSPYPESRARTYALADYKAHKPKQKLLTSSKDRNWFNNTLMNPSLDLISELHKRRKQTGLSLYDYRQKLGKERPGEDEGKLDVEAAYSDLGNQLALYDSINNRLMDTTALEEYYELHPSDEEPEEEQIKLEEAFGLRNSKNAKKYLKTKEGEKYRQQLDEQQIEVWKNTYKPPKKKK